MTSLLSTSTIQYDTKQTGNANQKLVRNDWDRIQHLTMASKAMKLKPIVKNVNNNTNTSKGRDQWQISERRQVGDAEEMMYPSSRAPNDKSGNPWWKNVGMEEGL